MQGPLRGLEWVPSPALSAAAVGLAPALLVPGGPPTWDIKVSQAEDKPNPMETPQTLTNWSHTQERTQAFRRPRGTLHLGGCLAVGDPSWPGLCVGCARARLEVQLCPQAVSSPRSPGKKVLAILTATERVTAASSTVPRCPQNTVLTT